MVDTVHFTCRRPLKPEVVQEFEKSGTFENDDWIITTGFGREFNGRTKKKIELHYKHKPLKKSLMARGENFVIEWFKVELPLMLFPVNGMMLRNQSDLNSAMERIFQAFDSVAERGVPWTDTVRLDAVMNLPLDPDMVLNIHRAPRALGLHKDPQLFEDGHEVVLDFGNRPVFKSSPQSVQMRGKELWLSMYNKRRQQMKKSETLYGAPGCLRIEVQLKNKNRIARFLGVRNNLAIARLDYLLIYRSLRALMLTLPGGKTIAQKCTLTNLAAACLRDGLKPGGLPVTDWLRSGMCDKRYRQKVKEIAAVGLQQVGIVWKDLLPPTGPPEMVDVDKNGSMTPVYDPSWGPKHQITWAGSAYQLVRSEP